jgi:hypothetical protein
MDGNAVPPPTAAAGGRAKIALSFVTIVTLHVPSSSASLPFNISMAAIQYLYACHSISLCLPFNISMPVIRYL